MEASFWRRLWTCRQTEYWMNECTLRTGEDILIWRRRLWIALYGGIVLEEALDLSSDRTLNDDWNITSMMEESPVLSNTISHCFVNQLHKVHRTACTNAPTSNVPSVPTTHMNFLYWHFKKQYNMSHRIIARVCISKRTKITVYIIIWSSSVISTGRAAVYCLRHYATTWQVAGSNPDCVIGIFQWRNPSGRTMALGSTQPLTEMSTRCISWG